ASNWRIRLASSPPETKIPTWSNPAWSSRARTSFTRSTVTPPRSLGVSRRTPRSRLPRASATRSASSASSLNVSTRTIRSTSSPMCSSKARAAFTVSPKRRIIACGLVDPETRVRRADAQHRLLGVHVRAFGDRPRLVVRLEDLAQKPDRLGDAAQHAGPAGEEVHGHDGVDVRAGQRLPRPLEVNVGGRAAVIRDQVGSRARGGHLLHWALNLAASVAFGA